MDIKNLCEEFYNHARYRLAMLPIIPNDKVMAELGKEGWQKVPYHPTEDDILRAAACPEACGTVIPSTTIVDAQGRDAFKDPTAETAFKKARQHATARVYGITPP